MAGTIDTALKGARQQLMGHGWHPDDGPAVVVLGLWQKLAWMGGDSILDLWPVSTGAAGFGNSADSGQTPTGLHKICACIGHDAPPGMVFRSREPTGEILLTTLEPGLDRITSRILWLEGLEEGVNRGEGVDSRQRYIYIHGTPYAHLLGKPVSAGCVRMDNHHVISLFQRVSVGTYVLILPQG